MRSNAECLLPTLSLCARMSRADDGVSSEALKHLRRGLVLLLAVTLFPSALRAQSLDGIWRAEGYGDVYDIHGDALKVFEVTTTTCVPGETLERDNANIAGREGTFKTKDGDVVFMRSGGTANHKLMHEEGSASDRRINRLDRLPAVCDHPTTNTPADNFEVFARTWAENYILFNERHADWNAIVAANRKKVTPQTTSDELFDALQSMIAPFHDAHTSISAPDLKQTFHAYREGTERINKGNPGDFFRKRMPELHAVTDRVYLDAPLHQYCNGRVSYGHVKDTEIGYLRILAFAGYAQQGGYAAGSEALESALDEIFSDPKLKALVIDVRINFGGYDPWGLAIASRLATHDYLAYAKVAHTNPPARNPWTPPDPSMVRPSSRPGFHGPVVELTSAMTISAGETFTQALMGRAPHVTRIGENTQGVFSDVLGRSLPNGWKFGLPNEIYRNEKGKTFDVVGIPPEIEVPVFADADVSAGKDPAMARALEILNQQLQPTVPQQPFRDLPTVFRIVDCPVMPLTRDSSR